MGLAFLLLPVVMLTCKVGRKCSESRSPPFGVLLLFSPTCPLLNVSEGSGQVQAWVRVIVTQGWRCSGTSLSPASSVSSFRLLQHSLAGVLACPAPFVSK